MKLEDLMKNTPETLAAYQHQELKNHVLNILKSILEYVEQERYEEIESKTFYSPAGDGYGSENNCINFSYSEKQGSLDIVEITGMLLALKRIAVKR